MTRSIKGAFGRTGAPFIVCEGEDRCPNCGHDPPPGAGARGSAMHYELCKARDRTIRLDYNGNFAAPSWCDVRIGKHMGPVVIVCAERDDNPGTSVTNAIEAIATKIAEDLLPSWPVDSLLFVEAGYTTPSARLWSVVRFDWCGRRASRPVWSILDGSDLDDLASAHGLENIVDMKQP